MNILSISTILPIPGVIKTNDFVFQTYINYSNVCSEDHVVIIKPVKLSFNLLDILRKKTRLQKLKANYNRNIEGFQVEIFPFFSAWGIRNLHSILTRSIFYLNTRRIKKLIASHQIDVVHAQYIYSDGMLAYLLHKKFGIPYLVTTHNERFYFDHWLSKRMALKILRNASEIIPINWTNAEFYKSLGLNKINLVPLGFMDEFIKPQRKPDNTRVRILTVSVLTALKNIDKVLYGIRDLVHQYDVSYTIIGKGPEKENLTKLVKTLDLTSYVEFHDQIPHEEIAEEMYKYDVFIMPSYFETFGRVYFECMAMGIPIICAKDSGIYGIFKEGVEGLSVNHTSPESIAEALEFLITHPKERLRIGIEGQKLVEKHTWSCMARTLHTKYQLAIASNK